MSWLDRDQEPALDSKKLVLLEPNNKQHRDLCRHVVDKTRTYLRRVPLLKRHEEQAGEAYGAHDSMRGRYRERVWDDLVKRRKELAEFYAGSKLPVTVEAAWEDWKARQVAFQEMDDQLNPLYLIALDELSNDLHRVKTTENNEPYFVAVLVSQAIAHSRSATNTIFDFHSCHERRPQCA